MSIIFNLNILMHQKIYKYFFFQIYTVILCEHKDDTVENNIKLHVQILKI